MSYQSTNIHETLLGALNIAPTKISGQYKIVVTVDNELYLDDYTGRRVAIDTSESFLEQVSNFLSVSTALTTTNLVKTRYGGFQESTTKSYHVPFYLGATITKEEYPKYFVLGHAIDGNIDNIDNLFKYSTVKEVIDLEKIGLYKIFDEINSNNQFNYPLYFNWSEGFINLHGYNTSTNKNDDIKKDLVDMQSNQPYFDIVQNKILNLFSDNNLIFPRFLNLEFEFDYESTSQLSAFANFIGFLATTDEIDYNTGSYSIDYSNFIIKVKESTYNNTIDWKQYKENIIIDCEDYDDILSNGTLMEVTEQIPQIRFYTVQINVSDKIVIYDTYGDIQFKYVVTQDDIVSDSLYSTLINVCENATDNSNNEFLFSAIQSDSAKGCFIKIKANLDDALIEEYTIEYPTFFKNSDRINPTDNNYNKFRALTVNDCWLYGKATLFDGVDNFMIGTTNYDIVESFKFNTKLIIRVTTEIDIDRVSVCKLFENKTEQLISLIPIPFMSYDSDLENLPMYEQQLYIDELNTKFLEPANIELDNDSSNETLQNKSVAIQLAIETFTETIETPIQQYVIEDADDIVDTNKITIDNYNVDKVYTMIFASSGQTGFMTPNTLNFDLQCYKMNGCLDTSALTNDNIRFNWFLIKGECPDYLKNDIRSLRYFTDYPKLTSRLIKTSDDYSEAIFLGVKYKLPAKYENYQFAVCFDSNNKLYTNIGYYFEVSAEQNMVCLYASKYMDFIDLIRGGDANNDAFIDLSFLYNNKSSLNTMSEDVSTFSTLGLKLGVDLFPNQNLIYNTTSVDDWKFNAGTEANPDWVIALSVETLLLNNNISDLRDLLTTVDKTYTYYVYSTVTKDGNTYSFVSMSINIINVRLVESSYVWCEDVEIKFFDTNNIFVHKYDAEGLDELLYVNKDKIICSDLTDEIYGDNISTVIIDGQSNSFKLINPDKVFSFKEDYFEINYVPNFNQGFPIPATHDVFSFPECVHSDTEILENFDHLDVGTFVSTADKITLFNRNQIWRIVQDLMRTNIKYKELYESEVRKLVNDYMLVNLMDYVDINPLKIKTPDEDEYITVVIPPINRNVAIWNIFDTNKVVNIARFTAPYLPYFKEHNSLFDFQISTFKSLVPNRIYNIYDTDFGGSDINATGLWKEVQGNLVSSLYCIDSDIIINVNKSDVNINAINYRDLLIANITIDECIINNTNDEYISEINKNINEYIKEEYINYLLDNFYELSYVNTEDNLKLVYSESTSDDYTIGFSSNYNESYSEMKFVFSRK